jgi:hypothetical protein
MEINVKATCLMSEGTIYSHRVTGLLTVRIEKPEPEIIVETFKISSKEVAELPEPEE